MSQFYPWTLQPEFRALDLAHKLLEIGLASVLIIAIREGIA